MAPGITSLTVTNDQGVAVANDVAVTVTGPLATLFRDTFDSGVVDTNKNWLYDTTPSGRPDRRGNSGCA